ncbi:hypothetical protein J6590_033044 [Homalodisca vitripennis]|nr:hypothetical protein J6590_033044 [Homalodisca vitripennis]
MFQAACFPASYVGYTENYFASSGHSVSDANGYRVSLSQTEVSGECVATVTILGHGIRKVAEYRCQDRPQAIINLNKTLLVGDEYFTDAPGILVRLHGGSCTQEVFSKDSSTVAPLSLQECEKVKLKITILKEQQEKWNEWYKAQQSIAQQQFFSLQSSLAALQNQLFNGLLGGFNFGGFHLG